MDLLSQLFKKQKSQTEAFLQIQKSNGLWTSNQIPVEPTTHEGTLQLHCSLHWFNLEISEVLNSPSTQKNEEIADVLHFLLEFCILAGVEADDILLVGPGEERLEEVLSASQTDPLVFPDPDTNLRFTILAALRVADILKNKPWKQTLKDLDWDEFLDRVRAVWYWYGASVRTLGLTAEQLFAEYERKEEINYNRIQKGR